MSSLRREEFDGRLALPPARCVYLQASSGVCARAVLAAAVFRPIWSLMGRKLSSPTDTAGPARARAHGRSVRAADLP